MRKMPADTSQALTKRMTEELASLKVPGVVGWCPSILAPPEKNWRNKRTLKLDRMELLSLQSSLNGELQAKQQMSEKLSIVQAELLSSQK